MQQYHPERILKEKERVGRISQIKELVFGSQDGLLVPLGVVSSVAGAFSNNHIVIVAGVAEALAGAFSMATGAYLASQAERQVHLNEIAKEKAEIKKYPKEEKEELIVLYEEEGLSENDARKVVDILEKNPTSYLNTMIQKELGLEPNPVKTPMKDAILIGFSYLFSAFIPLFPYFFFIGTEAIILSILATLLALFMIGVAKGKVAALPYFKSGLQVLLVGAGSGIGGYFLGIILPHILGIK